MSDRDNDAGQSGDDASLFNAIVGGADDALAERQEQGGEEQRQEDEGEGQAETRERDEQGRFAQRRAEEGEDRAQRGLRKEVTGERSKRQQAEAERDAERREREADRREMARLQGIVEQLQRGQQPVQAQQQPDKPAAPPKPDRYTDPDGYDAWIEARAEERANALFERQAVQRADVALDYARQRDPQGFEAAVALMRTLDPASNARVRQQMLMVPDAGAYLLDWHKQEAARREIGADPNGFRDRVRADVLSNPAKLMEDPAFAAAMADYLRQQAGQGGQNGGPRTINRLPPSLGGARGSSVQRSDEYGDSDSEVFRYASRS